MKLPSRHLLPHRWLGPAFAVSAVSAICAASAAEAPSAPGMGLSTDGAYVLDVHAQVAWPRCVEGMRWNGKTCVGTALLLSHGEAMTLARDLGRARGLQLRVPRAMELQGLVHKATSPPGVDPMLFPGSPRGWHWSATSAVSTAPVNQYDYGNVVRGRTEQNASHIGILQSWAVNMSTGEARADVAKRTKLPVRLVLSLE